MPFSRTHTVTRYTPTNPPSLEGSEKIYLEREFRRLSEKIQSLVEATSEMQQYLEDNT